MGRTGRRIVAAAAAALVLACASEERPPDGASGDASSDLGCDAPAVREPVLRLGERMKEVPLLAPDSAVRAQIRDAYAPLVTPELLQAWLDDPRGAPGRTVSSPWPERIEVASTAPVDAGCRVDGEIVYVTSVEASSGGAAVREPVSLTLTDAGGWRIGTLRVDTAGAGDASQSDGPEGPAADRPADSADERAAADVVRRYYDAVAAGSWAAAHALWGSGGPPGGDSVDELAAGYAETVEVSVQVGEPGRVEGAAGSRYVEVPVTVRAVTRGGEQQRFAGAYTLRRVVVDGAPERDRRWHLYRAELRAR